MFCGRCSVASWRGKVGGWSSSSETRFIRSLIGAELFPADKTPGVVAPSPQHKQPHARAHTHTLTHGHRVSAKESREVGARTSFLSLLRFAYSAPQIKDRIRWTSGRVSRSRIREKPPPPPEKRRKTGERHEEAGKRAKKVF